jgi:hypothetical protein
MAARWAECAHCRRWCHQGAKGCWGAGVERRWQAGGCLERRLIMSAPQRCPDAAAVLAARGRQEEVPAVQQHHLRRRKRPLLRALNGKQ